MYDNKIHRRASKSRNHEQKLCKSQAAASGRAVCVCVCSLLLLFCLFDGLCDVAFLGGEGGIQLKVYCLVQWLNCNAAKRSTIKRKFVLEP